MDNPRSTPEGEGYEPEDMIWIPREDLQIIVQGLKEMPASYNQMAKSIELLAKNVNRSPSKVFTAVTMLIAVLVLATSGFWAISEVRNAQHEAEMRGKTNRETLEHIQECLDFVNLDAENDCAGHLISLMTQQADRHRDLAKCEIEKVLYRFTEANPELGVEVAEPDC